MAQSKVIKGGKVGFNWLPTAIADAEDAIADRVEASLMGMHLSNDYSSGRPFARSFCGRLLSEEMFATPTTDAGAICAECVKARDAL